MSRFDLAAIIQARMGSARFPGKTLHAIAGKPILQHVIERVQEARSPAAVVVATSTSCEDDAIEALCRQLSTPVFRGSEADVLERLSQAAERHGIATVIRITADNPLVGPDVIDFTVDRHFAAGADLTTTYHSKTFPNGTVLSVLRRSVLEELLRVEVDPRTREHVIIDLELLRRHFKLEVVEAPAKWRRYDLRYCVDNRADLQVVSKIIEAFAHRGKSPDTEDIIEFLDRHPEVRELNRRFAEGGY